MLWFKERSTNITINWRENSRTLRLCLEQSVCLRVCLSVCVCVNENCKKLQKINEKSNKNRMSCGFLTPIKRLSWESPMIWYDIRVSKGTLGSEVRLTWQGLHKWVTFSIIYADFQRILRLLRHGYGVKGEGGRGQRAEGTGQMGRWKDNCLVGVASSGAHCKLQPGCKGWGLRHVPPLGRENNNCSFAFARIRLLSTHCHAHSPPGIAHQHRQRRQRHHLPGIPFDLVIITVREQTTSNLTWELRRFLSSSVWLVSFWFLFAFPLSGIFVCQKGRRRLPFVANNKTAHGNRRHWKLQSHVACQ